MIIQDILDLKGHNILSTEPEGKLMEAVRVMVAHDVGSLVVMKNNRMLGMLTFREVFLALDRHAGGLGALTVKDFMVNDPIFGSPEDSVDYVRSVMTENHVRYLPVMQDDNLLGVISFHDVARACLNEASFENRLLKRYMKNWPQ